jgi:uncharacterized protein YbjT (DUF2867 family)
VAGSLHESAELGVRHRRCIHSEVVHREAMGPAAPRDRSRSSPRGRFRRGVRLARRCRRGRRGILTGEDHDGAIYNATGPATLTGAERAALVAEISGQPFSFLVLTETVLRQGMEQAGLPAQVVGAVLSIQEKFVQGGFDIVTGDVERIAGRAPRPLRDVLSEAIGAR